MTSVSRSTPGPSSSPYSEEAALCGRSFSLIPSPRPPSAVFLLLATLTLLDAMDKQQWRRPLASDQVVVAGRLIRRPVAFSSSRPSSHPEMSPASCGYHSEAGPRTPSHGREGSQASPFTYSSSVVLDNI